MERQATIAALRGASPRLSVGTLTADLMDLASAVRILEQAEVPLLHLDVMDGRVWPNITAGPGFLAGLRTTLLKDVHLLVEEPEKHIAAFAKAGADLISFSVEDTADLGAVLALIGEAENANDPARGILRGVSLNPATPLDTIRPHLDRIDFVLLLAVGPDTGKESFLADIPAKIRQLRAWKEDLLLFIDGSVKKDNIGEIAGMGSDFIVTGSAVFDGGDASRNLAEMKASIAEAAAV